MEPPSTSAFGTPLELSLARGGVDSAERLAPTVAILNESHLLAWSDEPAVRARFADEITWYLGHLPQNQTVPIAGAAVTDLPSLARQFQPALAPDAVLEPRIEGRHGLIDGLRHRPPGLLKHRFIVWRDADALFDADPTLFARAIDALFGVAAESEYAEEDRLLLLRVILVGSGRLLAHSREPEAAFNRWWREGGEQPLWATISGIERPRVHRLHVL